MISFAEMIQAGSAEGMPYFHIVGFKFKPEVERNVQANIMVDCQSLQAQCGGELAGILKYKVVPNVDARKGYTWIEFVLFRDRESFLDFHAHPAHQVFVQKIAQVADVWVVLDTDQLGSWFR